MFFIYFWHKLFIYANTFCKYDIGKATEDVGEK